MTLYACVKLAKEHSSHMQELIAKFHPLLAKYACLLNIEDGYFELRLVLIEAIHKYSPKTFPVEDWSILSYFKKTIRNAYIFLSKKRSEEKNAHVKNNTYLDNSSYDEHPFEFYNMIHPLTEPQKKVIILRYGKNYSDHEIANILGVSRQAVHRTRLRAIESLKKNLEFEK